jgi:ribonuclease-3
VARGLNYVLIGRLFTVHQDESHLPVIDDEKLKRCEESIGYKFADQDLLERALTHGSAKTADQPSNERYEFLGDSILGMIVSALLFADSEELDEGRMTKIKAQVVAKSTLAVVAEKIDLREFIIVGKMFDDRSSMSPSIISDAVEALIAAVYLDAGFDAAIDFVVFHFKSAVVEAMEDPGKKDYKSILGQWSQKTYSCNPIYRVIDMEGPDHDLMFSVKVDIDGVTLAEAKGQSKKSAEQEAARLALLQQGPI